VFQSECAYLPVRKGLAATKTIFSILRTGICVAPLPPKQLSVENQQIAPIRFRVLKADAILTFNVQRNLETTEQERLVL
jgi:hypothetical protein